MDVAAQLIGHLREMAVLGGPTMAHVKFIVETPRGSKSTFTNSIGIAQLPNQARSETAVKGYLERKRPGTRVTIISLDFT